MTRFAVLVSGRGSNLKALIKRAQQPGFPGRIALVLSNKPRAKALKSATASGIPTVVLPQKAFADRESYDRALVDTLKAYEVDWVLLAGFMRLLSPVMIEAFNQRIVNIHPSLLPAFPGLHPQIQALDAGVLASGCTVHLVDQGTDTGSIVAQGIVAVAPEDDEETLSERILAMEHRVYPMVMAWIAQGLLKVKNGRLQVKPTDGESRLVFDSH